MPLRAAQAQRTQRAQDVWNSAIIITLLDQFKLRVPKSALRTCMRKRADARSRAAHERELPRAGLRARARAHLLALRLAR